MNAVEYVARCHGQVLKAVTVRMLNSPTSRSAFQPGWKTSQSPRLCWGRRPALKAPPKAPFRKFWLICPLKSLEMLEKGSKFFAPSARFVGVVVRPGQMGLRPEVIRYPKKGQFCYLARPDCETLAVNSASTCRVSYY